MPRKDPDWAGKQNPKEKTQNTSNGQVSRVWWGRVGFSQGHWGLGQGSLTGLF